MNNFTVFKPFDREEWLEFRREHITATELAKLHLHKTLGTWRTLAEEKATGETKFRGNKYTDWGHEREPFIADFAHSKDTRLEYNSNNFVVVSTEHPTLAATPDMFDFENATFGAELKTTKHAFTGGKFHEVAPDAYNLQMQVNMLITGVEEWMLAWELHENFNPQPPQFIVVPADPALHRDLIETAAEFWDFYKKGIKPEWMNATDEASAQAHMAVAELVEITRQQKVLGERADELKELLRTELGTGFSGEIEGQKVSISSPKPGRRFDSKAFKAAHAELYQEFTVETAAPQARVLLKEVA